MWASGDYPEMVETFLSRSAPGPGLGALPIGAGHRVLDVAAGTGNAVDPGRRSAARTSPPPTSRPSCCRRAQARRRRRHRARRGRPPTPSTSRSRTSPSTSSCPSIGVMFAPHHQHAADELVRVCRPGGTIGLLELDARGHARRAVPHDGPVRAAAAGRRRRRRCGARRRTCAPDRRPRRVALDASARCSRSPRSSTPRDYGEFFKARYGPTIGVRANAERNGRAAEFDEALDAFCEESNLGTDDRGALRDGVPARRRHPRLDRGVRRSSAAPASRREETPSLPSTAETWWSTVFGVMTSAWAISALVAPRATRSSTSVSRGVSPAGPAREAARGPRGIRRTPSARRRRRSAARTVVRRARRTPPAPPAAPPRRRPRRAPPRARMGVRSRPTRRPPRASRRRSRARTAPGRRRARHRAGPPATARTPARRAPTRPRARPPARTPAAPLAAVPSSVAVQPRVLGPRRGGRARAAAARRWRPPARHASSSVAPASGSPRRACRRPSTISAGHRLTPRCSPSVDRRARVGLRRRATRRAAAAASRARRACTGRSRRARARAANAQRRARRRARRAGRRGGA